MLVDLSNVKDEVRTIPDSTQNVVCESAEVKENKQGTGEYIKCVLSITDGQFKNFKIFHMFNIKNQNVKAVEIGLSQLKGFMKCSGVATDKLSDVNQLIGLKCQAVLKVRKSDMYDDQTVVSYFKPKLVGIAPEVEPQQQEIFPF